MEQRKSQPHKMNTDSITDLLSSADAAGEVLGLLLALVFSGSVILIILGLIILIMSSNRDLRRAVLFLLAVYLIGHALNWLARAMQEYGM